MTFHYGHLSGHVRNGRVIADGCHCDLGPAVPDPAPRAAKAPTKDATKGKRGRRR
ncbi:MAG TPA: hypothetical protein VIU11_14345 [Nakamurella sp.]